MNHSAKFVKFSVFARPAILLTILLSDNLGIAAIAIAQSRFPAQAGRGFPYASGDDWSAVLGMAAVLAVLGIVIAVAAAVFDALGRGWHLIVLAVATFVGALGLTDVLFGHGEHPVEPGIAFFMMIPSFVVVGIVYLLIMKGVQDRRDRRWD